MTMTTIIIQDDPSLVCGFKASCISGEEVNPENPAPSHLLSHHIMKFLTEQAIAANAAAESVAKGDEDGEVKYDPSDVDPGEECDDDA